MKIRTVLAKNNRLLTLWAFVAAFGAYFCTYAFRKPYTTGVFEDLSFRNIDLKTMLIIAQVLGYTVSKFLGVKVIAELKEKSRVLLILSLIGISQVALILFASIPPPFNVGFMFLNGLPLGMVWGVIFSYLEGRRFTELLGMGLSVNMIMTSGILKSLYKYVQSVFALDEFAMPAAIGFIFLPLFLVFVWMLSQIPKPSTADIQCKSQRVPMDNAMKSKALLHHWFGLICVIMAYCLFTTMRDFRDNFMVEILKKLAQKDNIFIYAKLESYIALIVMLIIALLIFFRNNLLAYNIISSMMLFSSVLMLASTLALEGGTLNPFQWMACLGVSFYLPYLLIQIAFFERIIALFKINGNAGYFVYLCDSIGYLGSVFLLFYKEFIVYELSFAEVLINFSKFVAVFSFILLAFQFIFFSRKLRKKGENISKIVKIYN